MKIDWPWRHVPELRDLPRAEQNRLWRLCSTRSLLSWQFIASMALGFAVVAIVMFTSLVILTVLRDAGIRGFWFNAIGLFILLPTLSIGTTLAFQPWAKATRREIQHERERMRAT